MNRVDSVDPDTSESQSESDQEKKELHEFLVVSSEGAALEYCGNMLGLYVRQEGKHEGAPYYKQKHDTPVTWDYFLYRSPYGPPNLLVPGLKTFGSYPLPSASSEEPWSAWRLDQQHLLNKDGPSGLGKKTSRIPA